MTNELLQDLEWRGLLYQQTDAEGMAELLNKEKVSLYVGVDPTADSMHIGHIVPLLTLRRFQMAGHKPVLLVGGATGTVGDPSGRSEERQLQTMEQVEANVRGLKKQMERMFDFSSDADNGAILVNNNDWVGPMTLIDFLRDYGKLINVNYILNKDTVASRLDSGISFTEFAYTLIQGLDFNHLYDHHNVRIQVGGSDQWGNITAGIDLIRKKTGKEVYGFTMPLVLTRDGNKIGKSEGNAVWLDKNKTSSYEIYQYFLNSDDEMVIDYLKIYTFLSKEEIEQIEKEHNMHKENRLAQKTLAREVVSFLHGTKEADKAIKISEALFGGNISKLTKEEILIGFKDVPTFKAKESNIVDFLVDSSLASSKREAREFIKAGSITINDKKINDLEFTVTPALAIEGEILVVRRGKKKYFIGKF